MFTTFLAAMVGLTLGLIVTSISGENPLNVLYILFKSAFGTTYDLGMTVFYCVPLIFTGLGVAIGLKAGLFNVGAEGQVILGAFSYAAFAMSFPMLPWFLGIPCAMLVGGIVAGIWGMIPGILLVKRGAHEVISGIMLNFLAASLTSWLTIRYFKNPNAQSSETVPVTSSYQLVPFSFFDSAPVNASLCLAILLVFLIWFVVTFTRFGRHLVWTGKSVEVAQYSGLNSGRIKICALFLGGVFCSLVGTSEILGSVGRYKIDFTPGYGFTGIAVALMSRGNILAIIPSAFLFGALQKGASDLDFETQKITKEIALIFQALIILAVSSERILGLFGMLRFGQKARGEGEKRSWK